VGILFWGFRAVTEPNEEGGKEVKAAVSDLPAAVGATLDKEAPAGEIEESEKEEEHGKLVYHIEVVIDGKEYEVEIGGKADGCRLGHPFSSHAMTERPRTSETERSLITEGSCHA